MRIAIGLALLAGMFTRNRHRCGTAFSPRSSRRAARQLYAKECASCHGAQLDGSGQAPPLAGADFKGDWNGQTADDVFEKMQTSMPADRPGQLTREQNADILAFLLSANGFPAGPKELPTDAAVCRRFDSKLLNPNDGVSEPRA